MQTLPTKYISPHPELSGFPKLTDDQYDALLRSVKDSGIQTPLLLTPAPSHTPETDRWFVYDGRHRLEVAIDLGLESVPVVVSPIKTGQAVSFALESAVTGRQLTKSAIALIIFEQHSDALPIRTPSKGGRKSTDIKCQLDPNEENISKLSERYRIPRQYLTTLGSIRRELNETEWEIVRVQIIEGEASIPRLYAGIAGRKATAGAKRGAVIYAGLLSSGELYGLIPESFKTIRNGFDQWGKLPLEARAKVKTEWEELVASLPEELKDERI